MHISIRSQMIAGVAAVGATAVAITPISQTEMLPALRSVSANVKLSATTLVNPITAVGSVLQDVNTNIFNQALLPTYPGLDWPDFFWGIYTDPQTQDPVYDILFAPQYYGIVPDVINQFSFATLAALGDNLSGYAWAGIRGVGTAGAGIAAAAFNTPIALVTALGQLAGGDTQGAIDTLTTEILGPLQQGIQSALDSIGYILDNAIQNAQIVLTSFIPAVVGGLINTITSGIGYMATSLGATAGAFATSLSQGDFAGAWNVAVEGLLGRTGTLGQLEKLTLGVGIVEDINYGTDVDPDIIPTVTVPSFRSVIASSLTRLGSYKPWGYGGIYNDPFVAPPGPLAAVKPAATAARVEAPAAAEVSVADVAAAQDESAGSTPAVSTPDVSVSDVSVPDVSTPAAEPATAAPVGGNGGGAGSSASKPGKRTAPSHKSTRAAHAAAE